MKRENFFDGTEACPGYCRVVRVGPQVFVSGTTSADDKGHVVGDTVYAQTREIYRKMERAMKPAGAGLGDIVRVVAYVTDIGTAGEFIKAHSELFAEINPAATLVALSALVKPEMKIEIEATAIIGAAA
jgi:enamine deaminase RidA (YjgF/YER057c/UK114 family)